jgi:hypothetical protein
MGMPRGTNELFSHKHPSTSALMRSSTLKDAGTPAQKWLKEVACSGQSGGESGKDDHFLAHCLHQPSMISRTAPANRGFRPETAALHASRVGKAIAQNFPNPARKLRPPTVRQADSVRNSEQTLRFLSKRHFAVANCECFDTLRVQARNQLVFGSLCRRLCSHFFAFRAPGEGALAWNRIHRNGG